MNTLWPIRSTSVIFLPTTLLLLFLASGPSFATDWKTIVKGTLTAFQQANPRYCAEMQANIPAFQCDDGTIVNDVFLSTHPAHRVECDHPEELYDRCVNYAYLFKLTPGGSAASTVTMFGSCRPTTTGVGIVNPDTGTVTPITSSTQIAANAKFGRVDPATLKYSDVAVISYDSATGATCFFQAWLGNATRSTSIANTNFVLGSGCPVCHANGPFIRTPHYYQAGVLPGVRSITKYLPATDSGTIVNVENGTVCTTCHNIGAYAPDETKYVLAKTNKVAAGETNQIFFRNFGSDTEGTPTGKAPTATGYDDYMVAKVMVVKPGLSPAAARALGKQSIDELQHCLTASTLPTGCKIKDAATGRPLAPLKVSAPPPGKLTFVTSTEYISNMGGLKGADARCDARAKAAKLPGSYKAWLSTPTVNAKDRVGAGPYVRVGDHKTIATSKSDLLDGTLVNAISQDEYGKAPRLIYVWTGTSSDGTFYATPGSCSDWGVASSGMGLQGLGNRKGAQWTNYAAQTCVQSPQFGGDHRARLYCFQE